MESFVIGEFGEWRVWCVESLVSVSFDEFTVECGEF